MKKTWILLAMTTCSLALFTACTSNADTMPQNSPTVSNAPTTSPMTAPTNTTDPGTDMTPSATHGMNGVDDMLGIGATGANNTTDTMNNGGVNTVEDALRVSDQISEEVEKLSELEKAEAVVGGNIALVAVAYDSQYQGGLTDRLRDMVTERVETIDKAITTVHVSDDQDMVTLISSLREKLKSSSITFEELQAQILDAGSTIAGGGTPEVSQPQSNTGA